MQFATVTISEDETKEWENAYIQNGPEYSIQVINRETQEELASFNEGEYVGYGFAER